MNENEVKTNEVAETGASVDTATANPVLRDDNLDVSSLLKVSKEVPEKKETALEKMKRQKEEQGLGMVVDNKALAEGNAEKKLIANKSEDDAVHEVEAYLEDMDKTIAAAQNVKFTEKPKNAQDVVAMMDALEKAKTDDAVMSGEKVATVDVAKDEVKESTPEEAANEASDVDKEALEKRQNIVKILIDKTNLGADAVSFTDDEKEKLFNATEIQLKEVETVDLASIKVKKANKSFMESIDEYQLSVSLTPVVFPASGFRAEMAGLSYGEMGDVSLNSENVTFDQLRKKLTVIYNKMRNPSCGKFESFEDFLQKFAYIDIDIATYGLIVASFPEVDDIQLNCNNEGCKKSFNHKYSPRTLIQFSEASDIFLESMKNIVECPPEKAKELMEASPTHTHKRIKLPKSGIIIEIGIASAYDYLYDIVDNIIGDKFKEKYPDDVNGILQLNTTLLGMIRKVYVPDKDGTYYEFDKFDDMIEVLYNIKPEEISIVAALLQKYTNTFSVSYELTNAVCPHCGAKTPRIPVDVNSMVFLKYNRLMSTDIDISHVSIL